MSQSLLGEIDPHFLPLPEETEIPSEDEENSVQDEDEEMETLKNTLLDKVASNLVKNNPENFQDETETKTQLLTDISQKVEQGKILIPESEECFQEYAKLYNKCVAPRQNLQDNSDTESVLDGSMRKRKRSRSRSRVSRKIKEKPIKVTDLKPIILEDIPHDSCILFQSKRRGGKSYAIISILLALSLPRIVLFGKGRDSAFWIPYVKKIYMYSDFDEDRFAAILRDQEQLLNLTKRPGFEHLNIDLAIVLEDFSYDDHVMRSKAISDLVSNGRRLHILFLCSAQYLKSIKPKVRTQFDLFFLFQEKNADVRKTLYDATGSYFDSKEEFFKILDTTATNRRCLVINNSSDKTEKTEDFTRYFKAKTPLEQRELGSLLYRMFSELYFQEPNEVEHDLSMQLEETRKEDDKQINGAKPKIILKIPEYENVPVNIIEEQANKKGTFEVYCYSGKNEQHIITFSDENTNPP